MLKASSSLFPCSKKELKYVYFEFVKDFLMINYRAHLAATYFLHWFVVPKRKQKFLF